MNFKHSTIAASSLAALSILAFSHPASASHYRTASGNTSLDLREVAPMMGSGYYFTTIGGTQWKGAVNVSLTNSTSTTKTYQGSFNDRAIGSVTPSQSCSGSITIVRTQVSGNYSAAVTWTISGGAGCPSPIGSQSTLTLNEARPVANSAGNFTASQANTVTSETAGLATWPSWKVVDPTPLNCRTTPTGSIVMTFPTGSILNANYLGLNGIVMSAGVPWMHVRTGGSPTYCVVRANSSRIQPRSLPY